MDGFYTGKQTLDTFDNLTIKYDNFIKKIHIGESY